MIIIKNNTYVFIVKLILKYTEKNLLTKNDMLVLKKYFKTYIFLHFYNE